jgi:hypothetical protein
MHTIRCDYKARIKVDDAHGIELAVQHRRGFGLTGVYVSITLIDIEDGHTVFKPGEGKYESVLLAEMPRYNAKKVREHSVAVDKQLKEQRGPVWEMVQTMKRLVTEGAAS